MEIKIPELGENVDEAEVLRVLVSEGDRVEEDDPILELQTDKATTEMPSPASGKVTSIRVSEGDTVSPGQVVLELGDEEEPEAEEPEEEQPEEKKTKGKEPEEEQPEEEERQEEKPDKEERQEKKPKKKKAGHGEKPPVPAGPATRRFAREAGVDLRKVAEETEGKRVTRKDVKAFLAKRDRGAQDRRESLTAIQRTSARKLARAWPEIPLVTHHDEADVTDLERGRRRIREREPELPLTVTAIIAKAVAAALRSFPRFNASFDAESSELLIHGSIDLGIAVDTEDGLLVPVIRSAAQKSTREIAEEIADLSDRARDGALSSDELSGSTFSITNLGGIGGTSFTPLVNPPEVAILGLSRIRSTPVWGPDGKPIERLFLPLSLSYDHRAIDGAAAARFTRTLASLIESPMSLVLEI